MSGKRFTRPHGRRQRQPERQYIPTPAERVQAVTSAAAFAALKRGTATRKARLKAEAASCSP